MVEKVIYLEPEQSIAIERLSGQSGVSEAEIIRAAIEQHIDRADHTQPNLQVWEAERAYLQHFVGTSEQVPRSWHRDDLYDR